MTGWTDEDWTGLLCFYRAHVVFGRMSVKDQTLRAIDPEAAEC